MKDFKQEFTRIVDLINSKESLVFVRYGDGEVLLMNGESVGTNTQAYSIDKWSSNGRTILGEKLNESIQHIENNWYYGIPCECCNKICKEKLLKLIRVPDDQITYANLWVNSNYKLFKSWINYLTEEVIIIGNKNGSNKIYPFPVKKYIPIPDDCVNFYEKYHKDFTDNLINETNKCDKQLFFVSAGPLSEVIIDTLYKVIPNNRFIDVGSSLDAYIHAKITRPYMIDGNYYNLKYCKF